MTGLHVLITGGSGKFGPNVCQTFLENGHTVRVLLHQHKMKSPGKNFEIAWGDITQPDSVRKAIESVDAIVHLAGIVEPLTEENPELALRVNAGGTRTLVDLSKETGRRIPFVFISSVAVFGPTPDATECLDTNRNPCNPTSVYAKSKMLAEELIKESGIDYVILRLTAVPYPRISLKDMKTFMFNIPLENRIEFCHPDDAALAVLNTVKNLPSVKGSTLIIAGGPGQQMRYEDMLRKILGTFGLPLPPQHKFTKEPFPLDWYDTSRSQELLKYQQRTLDDYVKDLAGQLPAPLLALMRNFIGPAFGGLIVRLL